MDPLFFRGQRASCASQVSTSAIFNPYKRIVGTHKHSTGLRVIIEEVRVGRRLSIVGVTSSRVRRLESVHEGCRTPRAIWLCKHYLSPLKTLHRVQLGPKASVTVKALESPSVNVKVGQTSDISSREEVLTSYCAIPFVTVSDAEAVAGYRAGVPCDLSPPVADDSALLVIWYKNDMKKPIYSYDVRDTVAEKARHWSEVSVLSGRAVFRPDTDPAQLTLNPVKAADVGMYRCRVDFRKSPTRNAKVNLTVI
ncbi:hypothetical protein J6590_083687, partial [Homalodisca vitripennis]